MSEDITFFKNFERHRDAELITPPNLIKEKVGSGGINPTLIQRAEDYLQSNKADFAPIADMYFTLLDDNMQRMIKEDMWGEESFEALLFPLVQLKSHGSMFQYPLVTEISGMLINFLEVIQTLDKNALDVILAHKMTLKAVLASRIKDHESAQGRALVDALQDACMRYFQTHGA